MRRAQLRLLIPPSIVCAALVLASRAAAAAETEETGEGERREADGVAMSANRGLHLGLGPAILIPTDGGPMGGGASLDLRYGIQAGPLVVAPGGMAAGYLISERFVGTAMPTVRVTVPVGFLAPYVLAGAGPGWVSNPSEGGVALMAGGGVHIHLGRVFAIGGDVTYQVITDTEFRTVVIGPSIRLGG